MENIDRDIIKSDNEENAHKSRCIECPAYNECMGVWLNYFSGNGNSE